VVSARGGQASSLVTIKNLVVNKNTDFLVSIFIIKIFNQTKKMTSKNQVSDLLYFA